MDADRWWRLYLGAAQGWYSTWPGADLGIDLATPETARCTLPARIRTKVHSDGGVKFQLDEQNQLFLGVGKTSRAPINTAALYDFWNAAYASAIGSQTSISDAEPEQALTADLGWRYYGDNLSTVLDLYATNFEHKQFSGADPMTHARSTTSWAACRCAASMPS